MRAYTPRKAQTRHTAGAVGAKFQSFHPKAHQPQKVAPLSFPLQTPHGCWWMCDRETFTKRTQELTQCKAWGKGAEARVGSGVDGAM
jgi:hypothetical protein